MYSENLIETCDIELPINIDTFSGFVYYSDIKAMNSFRHTHTGVWVRRKYMSTRPPAV